MNREERRRQEKSRRKAGGSKLESNSAFTRALEHHQAGRLEEAAGQYRNTLNADPENVIAYSNLGAALNDLGRFDEAISCYDKALSVDPNYVEALNNKGNTLKALGRLEYSIACFKKALTLSPDLAQAHYNLGTVFQDLERMSDAVDCFQKALAIQPEYAEAHNNLGNVFKHLGRLDEAVACLREALALRPNHAATYSNLGEGLCQQGLWDDALACYRKALDLDPGLAEAHSNLGNVLHERDQLDDAVACYRKAISLKPDYAEAYNNLGNALNSLGELEEAIACYEKAVALKPDFLLARNNHLHVLLYLPEITNQELFDAYRRIVGGAPSKEAQSVPLPTPAWSLDTRLRIGYLSSDFHDHPVGRNVLPLISNHDHDRFEIFCYAEVSKNDDITEQFKRHADHWRIIKGLADVQVAEQISDDQIHILVYLGGPFDENRPSISSHHPAPVQASMFSGTTTALNDMDFWITDGILNPETTTERFSENLVRLVSLFTYPLTEDMPRVSALPADENGFVTFASFNKPCKMTDDVLDHWSMVLAALPDARLHLKFKNYLENPSLSRKILARFERNGIAPYRIALLAGVDSFHDHLAHYHQADIALDTFPFSGATTTFQALWMGVPVISLLGDRFISRMGASLSLHAGLDGVTALSAEEYVERAVALANDRPRLRELRASLRQRLAASPVCDGPGYARNMEDAFQAMWAIKAEN